MPQPTAANSAPASEIKVEKKLEMSLEDVIKARKKRRRSGAPPTTSKKRKTAIGGNISTASLASNRSKLKLSTAALKSTKSTSTGNPKFAQNIKTTGLVTTKGGGISLAPKQPADAKASAALSRLVKRTQSRKVVKQRVQQQQQNTTRKNKLKSGQAPPNPNDASKAPQNGSNARAKVVAKSRSRNTTSKSRSQAPAANSSARESHVTHDDDGSGASSIGGQLTSTHARNREAAEANGDRMISFLPEPDCIVRISGLHSDALEDQIKNVFSQFGPVTKVKMEYDSYQRFVGVVYVTFKSVQSGERAVSELHGKVVDGKTLHTEIL